MGMDIFLSERIFLSGAVRKRLQIISPERPDLADIDVTNVTNIILQLGTYRGYEVSEFLSINTQPGMNGGAEWTFTNDIAGDLLEEIDNVLRDPSELLGESDEVSSEYVLDQLREIKTVIEARLACGADEFEVQLWF